MSTNQSALGEPAVVASGAGADEPRADVGQPGPGAFSAVDVANLPRGTTIGRYLVVSRLGAGGMGVVYAAYDPELDRKVAIKLLLNHTNSAGGSEGRARLLREAQAMARVSHPNVISVFDIGTAFGQVFVAMEFVDGGTLTDWLAKPRSQAELLNMFTLAGRGLAAAHAAGLVHRDFKPDNVLIGTDGRVRVTDFGVVRSVDQPDTAAVAAATAGRARAGESAAVPAAIGELPAAAALSASQPLSLPLTQVGALMGTPRYMAPEQFMGRDTDPRTDQFNFCVAVYEATYGVAPFAGNTVGELCCNVIQGLIQSPPPDRRVPAWLRKALLRGLSLDPGARYASMEALLAALSLEARISRRRWLAAFAGVLTVAAAIGLWVFYERAQKRLAESRCRDATTQLDRAWGAQRREAAHRALTGTGTVYAEDTWQRVSQNIERYLGKWQALRDRQCHATLVTHEQRPMLLERSLRCLDRRLHAVGAFSDLLVNADSAMIAQAADVSGNFPELDECEDRLLLVTLTPEKPEQRQQVDELNRQMAVTRLTGELGRYVEQRELAKKALATAQGIGYPPAVADAQALLADSESSNGDYAAADHDYFASVLMSIQGGDRRRTVESFVSLMSLSGTKLGQLEQAFRWQQLAAAELRSVVSSERIKQILLQRMYLIACQVHYVTEPRRLDLAETECNQSLALEKQLFPPGYRMEYTVLNNLAVVYKRQDRFDEAMALYQQVLAYYQKSRGPQHPSVSTEIYNIGRLFEAQDQYAEARKYYEQALQLRARSLGEKHLQLTVILSSLVDVTLRQSDFAAATVAARRYFDIKRIEAGSDDSAKLAPAYSLLGRVLYKQGQYDEALAQHQRAVELCQKHHCEYISHMIAEADDWRGLGKNKQALPLLEQALKLQHGASAAPLLLARNQFSLAQALWAADKRHSRERVAELTSSALALYVAAGRSSRFDAAELEAWRDKNGVSDAEPAKEKKHRRSSREN